MLITVIGRGHSGTRSISHTLTASGVFMGEPLNVSGDLLPPEKMYEACRVFAEYVTYEGNNRWDFSRVNTCEIPAKFKTLIEEYGKKAVPQWMERVADSFEGKIVALPVREDIDYEVSENLIVELYSR